MNKELLIIGFGISGQAAAKLALAKGFSVTAVDRADNTRFCELAEKWRQRGVTVINGSFDIEAIPIFETVVLSPGIDPRGEFSSILSKCGKVIGELEFAYSYCECPVLAITGTNGKTTTTELTTHILKECGLNVVAAGNIGYPLSLAALQSGELDYIIAEVSSFQLETIEEFSPHAAVVLNITSDHINRYDSFEHYADTKLKLLAQVKDHEHRFITPQAIDKGTVEVNLPVIFSVEENSSKGCHIYFDKSAEKIVFNNSESLAVGGFRLPGLHNIENLMAAVALSLTTTVTLKEIERVFTTFAPSRHRLEHIGTFNGVSVYNDSKSTNPDALVKAIESIGEKGKKNLIIIAGGLDKGMDFSETVKVVKNYAKLAILIGETKTTLRELWRSAVETRICDSLDETAAIAFEYAEKGDSVLFSPGCASMDMFRNYAERGDQFCEIIKRRFSR